MEWWDALILASKPDGTGNEPERGGPVFNRGLKVAQPSFFQIEGRFPLDKPGPCGHQTRPTTPVEPTQPTKNTACEE